MRISVITFTLVVLLCTGRNGLKAQHYTDPAEIPTGRLSDCAPVFNALDDETFSAEISSRQQYMEIKGHPSSYRLSLTLSPTAFRSKSGRFVLHGEIREKNHGFQRNLYTALGAASILRLCGGHHLYADLHYEFACKWYNLQDVISENPSYAAVAEKLYTHIPTACLGYAYHGWNWKAGLTVTGNAVLPGDGVAEGRRLCLGGTAWWRQEFGRVWKENLSLGEVHLHLNETWCSEPGTGHTVTAGFSTRVACVHMGAFYRHAAGLEYLGVSAGVDLGRRFTLFYSVTFPFMPGGITAGVAAHEAGLRFTVARNGKRKELNEEDKTSLEEDGFDL